MTIDGRQPGTGGAGQVMRSDLRAALGVLLALIGANAVAAEPQVETCEQLRARIGQPPLADPELLRTLAARTDCKFTAREFYRAAYGDRPLPVQEPHERRHRHHHDEDDD